MSKFNNIFLEYRKKLKEEVVYVSDGHMELDDVDTEYDEEDLFDQVDELEKQSPITNIRGKKIHCVYIDTGKVIAALYIEVIIEDAVENAVKDDFNPEETFSFDIIVHEKHQGKRIGTKLLEIALEEFNERKDGNDIMIIKVDVVNPRMKRALENKGFEVKEEIGPDRWLMGTIDEEDEEDEDKLNPADFEAPVEDETIDESIDF